MYPMGLNIKGRLKSIFRRPLSIKSSLHVQKSKCRLLFVMIGKNTHYFDTVYFAGTMQNNITQRNPHV